MAISKDFELRRAAYRRIYNGSKNYTSSAGKTLSEIVDNESNRAVTEYFKKHGEAGIRTPEYDVTVAKIRPGARMMDLEEIAEWGRQQNDTRARAAKKLTDSAKKYDEKAKENSYKAKNVFGISKEQTEAAKGTKYWSERIAENKRAEAAKIRKGEALPSYGDSWNDFISQTEAASQQAKETYIAQLSGKTAEERAKAVTEAEREVEYWKNEKKNNNSSYNQGQIKANLKRAEENLTATANARDIGDQKDAKAAEEAEIRKFSAMGTAKLLEYKKEIEASQARLRSKAQLKELDPGRVDNTQQEISAGLEMLERQLGLINSALISASKAEKKAKFENRKNQAWYENIAAAGMGVPNIGIENVLSAVQAGEATAGDSVIIKNKATFARDLKQEAEEQGIEAVWTDWQTSELEKYSYMTEDEVKLYSAILMEDGEKAADEYYESIESYLDARIRAEEEAAAEKFANDHPFLAAAESVALDIINMGNPLPVTAVIADRIAGITEEIPSEIDINDPIWRNTARKKTLQETALKDADGVESFFAGVAMSMASNIGARVIYGQASPYIMAGNAMTDTFYDLKKEGVSDEQAAGVAVVAGAAEMVFEKIEYTRLVDMWTNKAATYNGVAEYIKNYVLQEGMEESTTTTANILANSIMLGKDSDWAQSLMKYKAMGYTDSAAIASTVLENGKQIVLDGISGMISGGFMSGGSTVLNAEITGARMDKAESIDVALQVMRNGKDIEITQLAEGLLDTEHAESVSFAKLNELAAKAMMSADPETVKLGEKLLGKLKGGVLSGKINISRGDLIAFASSEDENVRNTALAYAGIDEESLTELITKAGTSSDSRMRLAAKLLKKMTAGKGATAYERGLNYLNAASLIEENAGAIEVDMTEEPIEDATTQTQEATAEDTAWMQTAAQDEVADIQRQMDGDERFSIKQDVHGTPFVVADRDILAGIPKKDWVKTVRKNLKTKFSSPIRIGQEQIVVDKQSRNEMTYSNYMKWAKYNDKTAYSDKLKITDNSDEIVQAAQNYVGEAPLHGRTDKIQEFARGKVLFEVGNNQYIADVVVATEKDGTAKLYDILYLTKTQIQKKSLKRTGIGNNAARVENALSSNERISQDEPSVNNSIHKNNNDNASSDNVSSPQSGVIKQFSGKITERQNKQLKVVDAFAKAINRKINIVDSAVDEDGRTLNGYFDPTDNSYTIALDAMEEGYLIVTTHESVHDIRQNAGEQYAKLEETVLKHLKEEGGDIEALISEQEKLAPGQDRAYYTEEIVANTVQTIIDDPTTLERFADRFMEDEEGRSAFKKLLDSIKIWLKRVLDAVRGYKEYEYIDSISRRLKDIDEIREKYFEGLEKAREQTAGSEGEVKPSIITLDDGKQYVQADRQVVTSNDPDTVRRQVYDYIGNLIGEQGEITLPTSDGDEITISAETTSNYYATQGKLSSYDEFLDEYGNLDDEALNDYLLKARAAVHIDEIVRISNLRKALYEKNKKIKHGEEAVNGWKYPAVFFMDENGDYYQIKLSVALGEGKNTAYNLGSFRNRKTPVKLSGSSLAGAPGNGSSKTNVAQNKNSVNTSIRKNYRNDTKTLAESDPRSDRQIAEELNARSEISKGYDKAKGMTDAEEILAIWAELSDGTRADNDRRRAEQSERERHLENRLYEMGENTPEPEGDIYQKAINKAVKKLLKDYDSKADKAEISKMVDAYVKASFNDERSLADLRDIADEIAENVIAESRIKDKDHEKETKPIKAALKGRRIALNEQQIAEVESWYGSVAEFKKTLGSYVMIRKNGEQLDSVWQEMAKMFPNVFDGDITDTDMPTALESIVEYLRPRTYTVDHSFHEAREDIFNDLYEACEKISDELIRIESKNADVIVTAYNLHAGEVTHAKKIAEGKADLSNMNSQFNKTGVRRLAEYFSAHPEEMERYRDGEYDLAKIKAVTLAEQTDNLIAEKDAKIARMRDRQRVNALKKKETETKRKLRESIRRNHAELLRRVEQRSNAKHIPVGFERLAAEAIKLFMPDGQNRQTQEGVRLRSRVYELESILHEMEKSEEKSIFAQEAIAKLKELEARAGEETIYLSEANEGTLRAADELMRIIRAGIDGADTLHSFNRKASAAQSAQLIMDHLENRKRKSKLGRSKFNYDMMDHVTFLDEFGDEGTDIRRAIDRRLGKYALNLHAAQKAREDAANDGMVRKLQRKKRKVKLSSGEYELTVDQLGDIYELTKRKEAQKHLLTAGVWIEESNAEGWEKTQRIRLQQHDFEKIKNALTKEERKIADKLQRYLAVDCAKLGNETSREMWNYDRYVVGGDYWSMMVDKDTVEMNEKNKNSEQAGLYKLQNPGFAHHTDSDAANALIVRGMFDTYTRHTIGMAAHNAFAALSSDLMKIVNHNVGTGDTTFKEAIGVKMGNGAADKLQQLIEDINGITRNKEDGGILQKLYGNAKAASVAANLSVMIQQPTAYLRAAAIMNPKYLTQAIAMKGVNAKRAEIKEAMHKYAPLTLLKSWGGADINVGKSNSQIILGNANLYEKVKEYTMKGAQIADDVTWYTLWNACLLETTDTTDLKQGSEEFYKAAAEKMNDLIAYTQVIDTPFHRAEILKKKDIRQLYTQFMSEPIKGYNLLRKAVRDSANSDNPAPLIRTAAAMLVTNLINSAAKSLIYALRDDEDRDEEGKERTYGDKWLQKFKDAFADEVNIFKSIPLVSEVWDYAEHAITGEYRYQSPELYEKGITQLLESVSMLNDDDKDVKEKCKAIVDVLSTFTGIGASNIWRDIEAFVNTFTPEEKEIRKKYFSDFEGEDDTLNEILAMYFITGDDDLLNDTEAPDDITADDTEIVLTEEEKQEYMLAYNTMYSTVADTMRMTDVWNDLTDEQKARAYVKAKTKAKEAAKYSIIGYPKDEYGEEKVKNSEDYAEACIYSAVTAGADTKEEQIRQIEDALGFTTQEAHYFYQYYHENKDAKEADELAREAFATKGDDITERELKVVGMTKKEYDTYMEHLNVLESTRYDGEKAENSKYGKQLAYISSRVKDKDHAIYLAKKVSSSEQREILAAAEEGGALNKEFLKMYSNYVQISGDKDSNGETLRNSKKQKRLEYVGKSCNEKQAKIMLKAIIGEDEKKQAVYELVKTAGYTAKEFAGWYSGAVTETSSDDIDTYLYTISGSCPNTAQELIYLLQAPSSTKYEYNIRMRRVLKNISGLTPDERDRYEKLLARN